VAGVVVAVVVAGWVTYKLYVHREKVARTINYYCSLVVNGIKHCGSLVVNGIKHVCSLVLNIYTRKNTWKPIGFMHKTVVSFPENQHGNIR
jgi:hypothetical protein